MAKAKSPRPGSTRNKKVLTMPEVETASSIPTSSPQRESVSGSAIARERSLAPFPIDVEAEIRRRAYQIYEERGSHPGSEQQDWALAEREVMARYNQQLSA